MFDIVFYGYGNQGFRYRLLAKNKKYGRVEMKIYKRTIVRLFFAIEIMVFVGVYLFGGNGVQHLRRLKDENQKLKNEVVHLQIETKLVEQQIASWQADDFYKEKIAREKLQMAKKGDEIYFIEQ